VAFSPSPLALPSRTAPSLDAVGRAGILIGVLSPDDIATFVVATLRVQERAATRTAPLFGKERLERSGRI